MVKKKLFLERAPPCGWLGSADISLYIGWHLIYVEINCDVACVSGLVPQFSGSAPGIPGVARPRDGAELRCHASAARGCDPDTLRR